MSKIVCVYHSIDLDGFMSAAIVKHWWMQEQNRLTGQTSFLKGDHCEIATSGVLTFIGYNYGQPILDLSEYDRVIMCDISFPKDEMFKLKDKLIWIDHHISAIKDVYGEHKWLRHESDIKGDQDTKFAACELTWKYFMQELEVSKGNQPIVMPEIVRLLGRYDCFGHKGTDEEQQVLEFQYGARQCISNYEEAYYYLTNKFDIENNSLLSQIFEQGKAIYQYLCTDAKQSYKNGFEIRLSYPIKNTEVDINNIPGKNATAFEAQLVPFTFICINKERFNPINFGIDYHKDGYDGAACFHFDGKVYNFSLYNDNGLVDCSIIAKQFGGGGHKGAAGFRVKSLNELGL